MARLLFPGLLHQHDATFRARDGSADAQQVTFAVNHYHAQILNGYSLVSHVASTLRAFINSAGSGS